MYAAVNLVLGTFTQDTGDLAIIYDTPLVSSVD